MLFRGGFRKRLDNSLYAWETPLLITVSLK